MRPLFWTKIPNVKLTGTVWLDFDDTGIDIHEDALVDLFKKPPKKKKLKKSKDGGGETKKEEKKKSVLDGQRQQNAGIAMTTLREKPEVYEDWIVRCSTKLTPEIIKTLLKLVPNPTETKMLKGSWKREDKDEIPPIDFFMLVLSEIPRIKERLLCILLSCEFEEKYEGILSNISSILNAVRKMKSSIKIKTIMETILALGNYINGSTRKGQCSAFELDTLKMLAQTKGNDGKTTLMMFLVNLIDDEVLDLEDLCDCVLDASKVTFKQVDEMCGNLLKETNVLTIEVKKTSDAPPSESGDLFVKAMQPVSDMIAKKVKSLNNERSKMKDAFSSFVSSYGSDPSKNGPEVFFVLWSTFFKSIESACEANEKLEQMKKATQKRDEQKNSSKPAHSKHSSRGTPRGNPMAGMMGELGAKLNKRKILLMNKLKTLISFKLKTNKNCCENMNAKRVMKHPV